MGGMLDASVVVTAFGEDSFQASEALDLVIPKIHKFAVDLVEEVNKDLPPGASLFCS